MLNFIDMDGVIAQTSLGLQRHLGIEEASPTDYNWCEGMVNWSELNISFWLTIPVYADSLALLKTLDNVTIVTHCFSLNAMIGKRRWLDHYWPGVEMINMSEKWLLAGPDRVLWDDYPEQIKNWEAAGGIGMLVKREWN